MTSGFKIGRVSWAPSRESSSEAWCRVNYVIMSKGYGSDANPTIIPAKRSRLLKPQSTPFIITAYLIKRQQSAAANFKRRPCCFRASPRTVLEPKKARHPRSGRNPSAYSKSAAEMLSFEFCSVLAQGGVWWAILKIEIWPKAGRRCSKYVLMSWPGPLENRNVNEESKSCRLHVAR